MNRYETALAQSGIAIAFAIVVFIALSCLTGCAINGNVSLGATAQIGYNAGSMSTPQESDGGTNSVHRVGGGSVSAEVPLP